MNLTVAEGCPIAVDHHPLLITIPTLANGQVVISK